MKSNGPIVVIEDDPDDQDIFRLAFSRLGYKNKIIMFDRSEKALEYFNDASANPFLIISDINMPGMDGLALRERIRSNPDLEMKCTPYIFFSTTSSPDTVHKAYCLSIQGFFRKENSMSSLEATLRLLVDYWKTCLAPEA